MAKRDTPLTQVVKGVEQLSDAQLKERTRAYIPSAIERLAQLCNSENQAISLGAIKVLIAKNIPDLKAMEISGDDKRPLLILDFKKYLEANRDNEPPAETD